MSAKKPPLLTQKASALRLVILRGMTFYARCGVARNFRVKLNYVPDAEDRSSITPPEHFSAFNGVVAGALLRIGRRKLWEFAVI